MTTNIGPTQRHRDSSRLDAGSSNLLSVAVMHVSQFRRSQARWLFRFLRPRHAYPPEAIHAGNGSVGPVPGRGKKSTEKDTARSSYIWRAAAIFVVCAALVAALMTAREAQSANVTPFFLVATPDLSDPLFQQSVILMLPPTQIPLVAGVIINKPSTVPVRKLFPDAPAVKNQPDTAYFGGPVDLTEPSLILRASRPSGKATRLFNEIYLSTDPRSIAEILKDPRPAKDLRLFLGRAQWTRDQLRAEILRGSWYVVPAKAELVFSPDPGHLWRILVERAQLQEVEATRAQEPNVFVLFCSPTIPAVSRVTDYTYDQPGSTI